MSRPAETSAPPAERRAAPRRQPAVNTVFRFDSNNGGGPQALALVWNISTTGISVLVPEPHAPALALTGYLDTTQGDHIRAVTLHVVHCKRLETGDYALGARFEQPLTEEELKPFVAEE
jgi:hypothetical protein